MGYAVEQSMEEVAHSQKKSVRWFKNWKFITVIILLLMALILGGISYYQATHFNAYITINNIEVDGMTAEQALEKLQTSVLTNDVYIGDQQVVDGNSMNMGFIENDLPEVKKLLKSQWTFWPSFEPKNFLLSPSKQDQYRSELLKNQLEKTLNLMNVILTAPIDSKVSLVEGKIVVSKSIDGEQFDVPAILREYDKQDYTSEIRLNPVYLQPHKEDSEIVLTQEKKLQEFLLQTVDYKVQDQVYSLKASELIKDAHLSEDLKVSIDKHVIDRKITEINNSQSTLGKDFTFKTHSGSVIKVKGQGYGWALDVDKETQSVLQAFEKGETTFSASNIYGNGWSNEGYGYGITDNNGIGDTYAEVSIAEQRIWIYREGKLVVTTNVVTGKHSTGEDTSPGVWYILFKRSPYTLTGSSVGNPNYSIEVDYWAPFTNSGQGFHDASWRTNWASNAYLTAGSGGCVNVSPSVMKAVYDNLRVYDPVVVY